MVCEFYGSCQKKDSCEILGECVFEHSLMKEKIPQAILAIHYSNRVVAVVNVLRKIRKGEPFKGTKEAAQGHMKEIGLKV